MRNFCFFLTLSLSHTLYGQWNNSSAPNAIWRDGKVGIGISVPEALLDVKYFNSATNLVRTTDSNGVPRWRVDQLFNMMLSNSQGVDMIKVGQDNTYFLSRVGIGTTGPAALLDIKYKDGSTNLYRATDNNDQPRWRVDQLFNMMLNNGQSVDIVKIGQDNSWVRYGDFGVGTTNPDGFQVNSALTQETSRGVTNVRLGIFGVNPTPRIIFDYANHTPFQIDNLAGKLRIYTPGTERLVITSDGNVGIGSVNPDQKLTVKGIIHAEEVRVDMTVPGPDYVFESTYNLLPLSEVESYIKANKHLPEVPSARQMEEEGLNLKEMNLLLLKKVEELTLHLIEAKKEIRQLQTDVEHLTKK
jgi:hypothetical protein